MRERSNEKSGSRAAVCCAKRHIMWYTTTFQLELISNTYLLLLSPYFSLPDAMQLIQFGSFEFLLIPTRSSIKISTNWKSPRISRPRTHPSGLVQKVFLDLFFLCPTLALHDYYPLLDGMYNNCCGIITAVHRITSLQLNSKLALSIIVTCRFVSNSRSSRLRNGMNSAHS